MAFSTVDFEEVKPSPEDWLIFAISDQNTTLFNYESMRRIAGKLKERDWKHVDVLPSGSLQSNTEELKQLFTKNKVDPRKAMKDSLDDELQTANKALAAFIFEIGIKPKPEDKIVNIAYWKPKRDVRNTPNSADMDTIQEKVGQLIKVCEELKIEVSIKIINGFYQIAFIDNKTLPQTIQNLISQINKHSRIAMRLAANRITSDKSHEKDGKPNKDYFDRHFDLKMEDLQVEITPWSAIEGKDPHPAYLEAKASEKIAKCLKEGTEEYTRLDALAHKLAEIRLTQFHEKYECLRTMDLKSFIEKNLERAKPFVTRYLLREIIYFQMLIDNAVKRYQSNNGPVKPCVYMAYPMNNPKDLSGRYVFEFVHSINSDIFKGPLQNAFRFLDTFNIMSPALLPAAARPVSDKKDDVRDKNEFKEHPKKKKLPNIFRTPQTMAMNKAPKPAFHTPPPRWSQAHCSQFRLPYSKITTDINPGFRVKATT